MEGGGRSGRGVGRWVSVAGEGGERSGMGGGRWGRVGEMVEGSWEVVGGDEGG